MTQFLEDLGDLEDSQAGINKVRNNQLELFPKS